MKFMEVHDMKFMDLFGQPRMGPRPGMRVFTVDCDRNRRARLLKKQPVQTLYDFSNQIVPQACFPDGIRVSNLLVVQID